MAGDRRLSRRLHADRQGDGGGRRIAARSRTPIGIRHFTKYRLIVTFATVGAAMPCLWLRHLI